MGLYFRFSGKERRVQAVQKTVVNCCHFCKHSVGTLRVERDLKGKKLKTKDGKSVYYHVECKVQDIMNKMQDTGMLQLPGEVK